MLAPIRAAAIVLACTCVTLRAAAMGDVYYVDIPGSGHFTNVQSAIDAAADGDLILVRRGKYPGFVLDGRSLSVVGDVGADARITGTVTVRNTPAGALVLLAELAIEGSYSYYVTPRPGLELLDNSGHVRVQGCSLKGGAGNSNTYQGGPGGAGVMATASPKVALVRCMLTGGEGYGAFIGGLHGGDGGPGLAVQGSAIALYDCTLEGGTGGYADYTRIGSTGGDGGDGCRVLDWGILASGCSFMGGMGGSFAQMPGDGGDGLVVLAGQAQLLDCTYAGGLPGSSNYGVGQYGQPQSGGGVFKFHPGSARSLVTSTLAAESASVALQIAGDPGDQVWLLGSSAPGFQFIVSLAGILLVLPQPMLFAARPLSVLPQSGTATIALPTSALAGGAGSSPCFAQGLFLGTDGWRLSSPVLFVVLDCSSFGPDCNANGSNDSCDILLLNNDCDKNGEPDDCQIQSGLSKDCNQNGVPDHCDLASGTSKDENGNGIPDECESGKTWYVDAAAPPGGNGSQTKPFKAIGYAIPLSVSGDTVLVANGTYMGPSNREISFGGRDIVVKSKGGAAQCIIDCENLGRAFYLHDDETLAARIEGFTITRGHATIGGGILFSGGTATIKGCNIDSCFAQDDGGGIYAVGQVQILESLVSRCNTGTSAGSEGGGMYLYTTLTPYGATAVVRSTLVSNCTATNGAGIAVESWRNVVISHCTITPNQASNRGGGLYSATHTPHPLNTGLRLDNTRLLHNTANEGGGAFLYGSKTQAHVTSVTIANNSATLGGGGLHVWSSGGVQGSVNLVNTILWNNSAPVGPQVQISGVSMVFNPSYSDIQGGQAQVAVGPNGTLNWGAGNIDLDPMFANAHLKLGPASPCIDAGDATAVTADWGDIDGDGNTTEPVPFDLALQPRVVDSPGVPDTGNGPPPIVDMGAYERQG